MAANALEMHPFGYQFQINRALAAQTLEATSLGIIFEQIVPWPPRRWKCTVLISFSKKSSLGRQDDGNVAFRHHFRADRALAAKTLKMHSFGTILEQIGPWPFSLLPRPSEGFYPRRYPSNALRGCSSSWRTLWMKLIEGR